MEIVALDPEMPDADFEATLALRRRIDAVTHPDVEPMPAAELRAYMDDRTENAVHRRWVGFLDAEPIAIGHLELPLSEANAGLAMAELDVDPERDRADGRPLARHMVQTAGAVGRTSFMAFGRLTEATDEDWTALGLTRRQVEQMSELDLRAVDDATMQAWVDDGRRRSPEVELVRWRGRCPDQHLDAMVVARTGMNDAPLDDLEWNDEQWTRATLRADEDAWRDLGFEWWTVLAIGPGGDAAGMTGVLVNTFRPEASWQNDTVVLPEFRGRRIGRWVKAAMWQWLRTERPDLIRLETGNADSNEHMLAINTAMGYRPTYELGLWQADIADLR